jgi:hypothetical protein
MRFATPLAQRAVACDMPIDVVQTILGYASLQTTSISVRAEQRGVLEAVARYYAEDDAESA